MGPYDCWTSFPVAVWIKSDTTSEALERRAAKSAATGAGGGTATKEQRARGKHAFCANLAGNRAESLIATGCPIAAFVALA
jgi:hypothetical protein